MIKFSPKHQQKIILRRSRGFAPNYYLADEMSEKNHQKNKILCLGGDLKNTFAVVPNNHVYISEYIGDLPNFETYERFEKTIKSYQKIFNFQPEIILKDLHPKYENQKKISALGEKICGICKICESRKDSASQSTFRFYFRRKKTVGKKKKFSASFGTALVSELRQKFGAENFSF